MAGWRIRWGDLSVTDSELTVLDALVAEVVCGCYPHSPFKVPSHLLALVTALHVRNGESIDNVLPQLKALPLATLLDCIEVITET